MKRICSLLLVCCCLMNTLALNIRAAEELNPNDSRYVSPEVEAAICDEDTVMTIQAYKVMIPDTFAKYSSIDKILTPTREIQYIQETIDGLWIIQTDAQGDYKKFQSGENGMSLNQRAVQEFKTGEAIKTVDPDIVVQEIYYLDSEDTYRGSVIFYRTNLGDYVYTSLYSGTFLFSADVFWEYMRAVQAMHKAKYGNTYIDGGPNFKICDLSAYDFTSSDFDPDRPLPEIEIPVKWEIADYLWVLLLAVPLAAILGIWAVKKRKPKDIVDNIV